MSALAKYIQKNSLRCVCVQDMLGNISERPEDDVGDLDGDSKEVVEVPLKTLRTAVCANSEGGLRRRRNDSTTDWRPPDGMNNALQINGKRPELDLVQAKQDKLVLAFTPYSLLINRHPLSVN